MAGVPGYFAQVEGDIPVTGGPDEVYLNVDSRDLRSATSEGILLRFGAKTADGAALSLTGLVAGVRAGGAPVALVPLADGTAIARVVPGAYGLTVAGSPGQEYTLEVGLAGDADGDRRIGRSDLLAIRRGRNPSRADVDGDGIVGAADLALARQNLGASTTIRPLTVSLELARRSDPDGDGAIAGDQAQFVARSRPGTAVGLDLGDDGKYDGRWVASGAGGVQQFAATVPAGANLATAVATDRFGQRVTSGPVAFRAGSQDGPVADLSGMGAIEALKAGYNWIIYEPVTSQGGEPVGEDQIRRELQLLYNRGFRGIVTYSYFNGREEIPRIAKEIGFQQVIVGIWARGEYDVEKANLTPARAQFIDGLVVGNETQLDHVYSLDVLKARMAEMKQLSGGKPTTTSEAWDRYVPSSQNYIPGLMAIGDWVFPNLHPFYERGWAPAHQNPADGVKFVANVLKDHFSPAKVGDGRLVALHESWWPSAQDGNPSDPTYRGAATPENQRVYFEKLAQTSTVFVYGEAFDEPWKGNEGNVGEMGTFGTHWGLWHDSSAPKPVVSVIQTGRRPG